MDYLKTNLKWEDFFTRESAELDEKMESLDMDSLSKSKLRLSLENNILDWKKYESWVLENLGCASLKTDIGETEIESFSENLQDTLDAYSSHDCWSEDLIPILTWDDQVIVLGLQYNENLITVPNHVFILAPPQILSAINRKISKPVESSEADEKTSKGKKDDAEPSGGIEGLSMTVAPLTFDFKDLPRKRDPSENTNVKPIAAEQTNTKPIIEMTNTKPIIEQTGTKSAYELTNTKSMTTEQTVSKVVESTNTSSIPGEHTSIFSVNKHLTSAIAADGTKTKTEKEIWEFVNERHSEYVFEVKKQFTAYLVLKVDYDKTRVYKMDPDLAADNVNEQLFNYSLREDNPFKRVYESGQYESFSVSQLGLNLKNFKYACITALKSGKKVVGFLVGFKDKNLSEIDQLLLEELAKETAA